MNLKYVITLFISLICSCGSSNTTNSILISPELYKTNIDGEDVRLYTLSNEQISIQITNYGGRIVSIVVPDKNGKMRNIVWQEPSIDVAINGNSRYSGAIIGRYANRVGNDGRITIEDREYQLQMNKNNQHLHGGDIGFNVKVWSAKQSVNREGDPILTLRLTSKDGECGYPGNLNVSAQYRLTKDNSLEITLSATTDAPTIINLTSHPFFNLNGDVTTPTNSHILKIYADQYTPMNSEKIVYGDILSVENTPLDFRTPHEIGERVHQSHNQLDLNGGYDINYLLCSNNGKIVLAAELYEPKTGIALKVYSDQDAIQLYGGPAQREQLSKSSNIRYGVALEAQNCPNAINAPQLPQYILYPNERYTKHIIYNFSTKD